ncbi:MAG: hypothetical protein WCS85_00795 [Candidatus Peribacteraceae bacterium]
MSKTKIVVGGIAFLSLSLLFVFGSPIDLVGVPLALAAPTGSSMQPDLSSVTNGMAQGMGFIILLLNTLAWIVFSFLDMAMNPSFIFGVGGGAFETMLKNVWTWSRDIVNIIFAFIFLGAAVTTVVTGSSEKLIKGAPKFVIALVLVNFTWFGSRVILDVANILASVVYNLPQSASFNSGTSSGTSSGKLECVMLDKNGKPKEKCKSITDFAFFEDADKHSDGTDSWKCPMKGIFCYKYATLTNPSNTSNILSALVINFGQLQNLTAPPSSYTGTAVGVTTVTRYIVRLGLVLIIHIGIIMPLVAMLFAFYVRIPLLWITIAFSPFVVIGYVLEGSSLKKIAETEKIMNTFLSSAFLPAMVGIPLSLGYMLIQAGIKIDPTSLVGNDAGALMKKPFPLFSGVNSLWEIFWLCMSLGVLWMGVFWVLQKQAVGKNITSSIKSFGENWAKVGMKAPLGLPLMPAPGGKPGDKPMMTLGQLKNMPGMIQGSLDRGESITSSLKSAFKGSEDTLGKKIKGDTNIKNSIDADFTTILNTSNPNATQIEAQLQKIRMTLEGKGLTVPKNNSALLDELKPAYTSSLDKIDELKRKLAPPTPPPAAPAGPAAPAATP